MYEHKPQRWKKGKYVIQNGRRVWVPDRKGYRGAHPAKGDYVSKDTDGTLFSDEERDFMKAMDLKQQSLGRRLAWAEVLEVATGELGYKKIVLRDIKRIIHPKRSQHWVKDQLKRLYLVIRARIKETRKRKIGLREAIKIAQDIKVRCILDVDRLKRSGLVELC